MPEFPFKSNFQGIPSWPQWLVFMSVYRPQCMHSYVCGDVCAPCMYKIPLKPWGLVLSEQPFSSCRPLARPVDNNLTSCDTSNSLKVRTSTAAPCGQWRVGQMKIDQAGKCPQDYVGFILLCWMCVHVVCRHTLHGICRTWEVFVQPRTRR